MEENYFRNSRQKGFYDKGVVISQIQHTSRDATTSVFLNNMTPQSVFLGIEDSTLHYFNLLVLNDNTFHKICTDIVTLRSHVAFYKVVEFCLKNKIKNPSIVIGALHLKDYPSLSRYYGVETNFYHTSLSLNFWDIMSPIQQ